MRRTLFIPAVLFLLGISGILAQSEPSVTWLAEDLNLPLRDGTAVDFGFQYEVHLFSGSDPEGDAALTLEVCENHKCFSQGLAVVEGTSFIRYGIDPTQYHRGMNLFTLTLTLTDNGSSSSDTLTIESKVSR